MIAIDKKEKIVFLLAGAFVIIKLAMTAYPHEAGWDESVYAGMGKYIFSGGETGLWEIIRPFGLPLLLGAVWKAGLAPLGWEVLAIMFAAGNILLTFYLARKIFNDSTGLFAALLMAGSTVLFSQSHLLMTELPSTFFMLLALNLWAREKKAYASGLAAAAVMFKFPHLLLGAVFAGYIAVNNRKPKAIAKKMLEAWPYAAIMMLFLAVNYAAYSQDAFDFNAALRPLLMAEEHKSNPAESVEGALKNIFFYPISFAGQNPFFLLAIPGMYYASKNRRAQALAIILISYLAYFTIIINKQERFGLLFMPIAAVFAGHGMYRLLISGIGTSKRGIAVTAIIFFIAGIASYSIIHEDYSRINERMNMQGAYYESYGTVLSSNPYPAYYTSDKVLHYYFSSADNREWIEKAVQTAEENSGAQIIYNESDFYCNDDYCRTQHEKLKSILGKNESS